MAVTDLKGANMKCNLVSIEETSFWNAESVATFGRIWTNYIYTPEEVTHLCSATPNYYLVPIDFTTDKQLTDAQYDDIYEAWCTDLGPGDYFTASYVDTLEVQDSGEFETLEGAREFYSSNKCA